MKSTFSFLFKRACLGAIYSDYPFLDLCAWERPRRSAVLAGVQTTGEPCSIFRLLTRTNCSKTANELAPQNHAWPLSSFPQFTVNLSSLCPLKSYWKSEYFMVLNWPGILTDFLVPPVSYAPNFPGQRRVPGNEVDRIWRQSWASGVIRQGALINTPTPR